MRIICTIWLLALAGPFAYAGVHTLNSAVHAVQKDHADTRTLVYKVRDKVRETMSQGWRPFLNRENFATTPMFKKLNAMDPRSQRTLGARTGQNISEFGRYFVRRYPAALDEAAATLALVEMYADDNIEFAYFEPRFTDAVASERMQQKKNQIGLGGPSQSAPPDFEALQFHLNAAPEGVDARAAWKIPGGTGRGIRIIDVETGWFTDHLEFGPVFYDNGKNGKVDHGTAVWGEIAAKPDGQGVTGIAYDVEWGIAANGFDGAFDDYPTTIAAVIETAVLQMKAGDLLVIEQHAPLVDDYGPIEYFEPVFKALQLATASGIHCVAASGNGYSNLDDPKYAGLFNPAVRDSGCVLVGAVDSPLNGRTRQRSEFSNYGTRIDAFGYGEDVVTTGYGDLFDGLYQLKLATYTNQFSGTSSATPIVAGAVASVLGIAKAKGVTLSPSQLRQALRATGTKHEGKASENVGTMPNIPELVQYLNLN